MRPLLALSLLAGLASLAGTAACSSDNSGPPVTGDVSIVSGASSLGAAAFDPNPFSESIATQARSPGSTTTASPTASSRTRLSLTPPALAAAAPSRSRFWRPALYLSLLHSSDDGRDHHDHAVKRIRNGRQPIDAIGAANGDGSVGSVARRRRN